MIKIIVVFEIVVAITFLIKIFIFLIVLIIIINFLVRLGVNLIIFLLSSKFLELFLLFFRDFVIIFVGFRIIMG